MDVNCALTELGVARSDWGGGGGGGDSHGSHLDLLRIEDEKSVRKAQVSSSFSEIE